MCSSASNQPLSHRLSVLCLLFLLFPGNTPITHHIYARCPPACILAASPATLEACVHAAPLSPPSLLPQPPSLLFPHSSSPRRHPNSVLRLACSPSEESGRQRPRHPHRAQGGRVLSSWLLLNVCRRREGRREGWEGADEQRDGQAVKAYLTERGVDEGLWLLDKPTERGARGRSEGCRRACIPLEHDGEDLIFRSTRR